MSSSNRWHGGKGSAARPTDKKKYEDNYDAIFGKKKKEAPAQAPAEAPAEDAPDDDGVEGHPREPWQSRP